MPIFMKAGSIKGDVTAKQYQGWVQVRSCGFEVKLDEKELRKIDKDKDGAPKPQIEPFEVQQSNPDRAGPDLMRWMVEGDVKDSVQFDVCTAAGEGGWHCNMRYLLKKVVLTDYSVKLNDGEKGSCTITMRMRYKEFSIEYFSYDKAGVERSRGKSSLLKLSK